MITLGENVGRTACYLLALCVLGPAVAATTAPAQEVIVLSGLEQNIAWLESENWWGENEHETQLIAPHALITGISPRWSKAAQSIPVKQKKELFYRYMLPLVLHANEMVLDRRARLEGLAKTVAAGGSVAADDLEWVRESAVLLRIEDEASAAALGATGPALAAVIDQALYKLDVIPPGLVLGQAAYESGYGTSRFATEGNALFGQWTFGGKGLVPEKQRSALGDHRIAAFDWPFDSVRGYFINLSSHPAYEELRRLRAELRASGKPVTSLALAAGLIRYSERGQVYVDELKGIIRVNKLDRTDDAVLRDEPIRFLVGADGPTEAAELRAKLDEMRASGELDEIIARMRLY